MQFVILLQHIDILMSEFDNSLLKWQLQAQLFKRLQLSPYLWQHLLAFET